MTKIKYFGIICSAMIVLIMTSCDMISENNDYAGINLKELTGNYKGILSK